MNTNKKTTKRLDYDQQKNLLIEFLKSFQDPQISERQECYRKYGKKKYLIQIQKVANLELKVIEILMEDLQEFFRKDQQAEMVKSFRLNAFRYIQLFEQIISQMLPQRTKEYNPQQEIEYKYTSFLKQQRFTNFNPLSTQVRVQNEYIPFRLNHAFDVSIVFGPQSKAPLKTVSQIRAENVGELILTKAIVVRSSEVRPQLVVGTYACDICNCENYLEISDSNFKPLAQCSSKKCKETGMAGKLTFLPSHSKFRSFQQLKIQETPEQLQRGSIPKSIHLQLRGSLINSAQPGDIVRIQGIVLPKLRSKNQLYKDLFFDSYIHVTKITREKKKYIDLQITEAMRQKVINTKEQMNDDDLFFTSLAKSIAPQIYGMETVKKALLLQMASGVTTQTEDHLKIRGEINVALFGDPGIAKSQLLKHISYISPRAVYTSGKGSSGVGLTAAIVIDPATKELSLQAGALVLADMGICCIDEFDKMEDNDRTAIHEVMEQQTVSITKAGIITTLNARTAVLAAANPAFGRYNKKETTQKNLNLPAALLSRFDLIFILLDTADKERDMNLARHIGRVHQNKKVPVNGVFDEGFLKTYIAMCKEFRPIIPEALNEQMIKKYIEKRQLQMDVTNEGQNYTTMRSLLAWIRLSQARAKLRFSNEVWESDVIESMQIIEESQESVRIEDKNKMKSDTISNIFELLKNLCNYNAEKKVDRQKLFNRVISRGFSSDDLEVTIHQYDILGILDVNQKYIRLLE